MSESGMFIDDEIGPNLDFLDPTAEAEQAFEDAADEILAYAQDNAPWSDITGDARNGLVVEVYREGGQIYLDLAHTVDYGIWLETIQNGRFAIIMPTLERFAPEVFNQAGGRVTGGSGDE